MNERVPELARLDGLNSGADEANREQDGERIKDTRNCRFLLNRNKGLFDMLLSCLVR